MNTTLQERTRIRRAQAGAIRSLRSFLDITECLSETDMPGCGTGDKRRIKHAADCGYGELLSDIRMLEAATRSP